MQTLFRFVLLSAVAVPLAAAWAGPLQDFEAAVKAGHPLSAEAAYREVAKDAGANPIVHYQAAEVAAQLGKNALRDDRWALYVRKEKKWTKEVEGVLWRMCSTGSDVDLFRRLAENVKPTRELWDAGRDMLKRLREHGRANEVLRLAEILLPRFADDGCREEVLSQIYESACRCGPEYPRADLSRVIMANGGMGDLDGFRRLLCDGNQRDAFEPGFAMRYYARHGEPMNADRLHDVLERLERIDPNDKDAARLRERDEIVKAVKEARERLLSGSQPWAARRFLWVAGARFPDLFYAGGKRGAAVPGLIGDVRKVAAFGEFAKNARFRNELADTINWMLRERCFTEAEAKEAKDIAAKAPKKPAGFDECVKVVRESKNAAERVAKTRELIAKIGADFAWWYDVEQCCRWLSDAKIPEAPAVWHEYRLKQAAVTGTFNDCWSLVPEKGTADKPFAGIDMKKMGAWNCFEYSRRLWDSLKPGRGRWQVLFDAYASRPITAWRDRSRVWFFYDRMRECRDLETVKTFPVDLMMDQAYAVKNIDFGRDVVIDPLRYARLTGNKFDEALRRYRAWADSLVPNERVVAYAWLLSSDALFIGKDGKWEWKRMLGPDLCTRIVDGFGWLAAAIRAVPPEKAGSVDFWWGGSILHWAQWAIEAKNNKDNKDPDKEKWGPVVLDFYDAVVKGVLAGARNSEGFEWEGRAWDYALCAAMDASNRVEVARLARRAAAGIRALWGGTAVGRMNRLKALGNDEALYAYVDGVPADANGDVVAAATKLRAEISARLPGIYPVDEKDPSYPLYVAADELSRKNTERAWQILQDPKNQTVFEREALKLPPDFVVWAVEQLRLARGAKDALLIRARQIATAILAQESKVSPEVAAAMILSIAEGYRDQQNFEAAKLEYQTLRDNPTYHATKYGKQAMFRAVDLQIATGNTQGVEAMMEYWLSQSDRDVQAQAHYFLAKIAFERKDYDETIKQLREVFAIHYTHTEGRFLQGQWKLATSSEVDETDVPVGDLSERSMIRPGSQLVVTVQDRNLSVAGGGASIPLVVTSAPGGDREVVGLYPTSRDPSVFKGLIDVRLGKACPSNRVVEVTGDDTVSYVIDPAFLRARGLPENEPRVLKVIDDAKLAIGAGAPRTDERKTEKGLKDILDDAGDLADTGVSNRLRPGNPLYIVVQDRDESKGGPNDSVRVTVTTSSGDRVEGFELKEEKPYSGVFRGRLETSLPPPRAYASDTAAGMNPGDVINVNKKTGWKSLADGKPGKWFAVDTMGSHMVSEVSMVTPSAADVKAIRLVGSLGKKTVTLGQLPAANEVTRLYLRLQQRYDRHPDRSLQNLGAFYQTDRAPKSKALDKGVQFRVLQDHDRGEWQTAYFHGPFVAPKGMGSLRLRLTAKSSKKDALRNLWVAVAVDGDEVFSGQGAKLQDALIECDLSSGCHKFEMAVAASHRDDEFDLLWEPDGEAARPIPADWFDETKHAALRSFVKDVAKIVQTKDGFKATLAKPTRLREIRWEFVDIKSPDVAITSIEAKDATGERVLPVENDFSSTTENQTLEVAPGDKISVQYEDARTTTGEKKVLQSDMSSSFNNAVVRFVFEGVNRQGHLEHYNALRFQPGDRLLMRVDDADCDVSDEADKIKATIRNVKGESVEKTLLETIGRGGYQDQETYGTHTGMFLGLLRTCEAGNTNAPASTLRVAVDDRLTLSYEDRENTDPGVPTVRTASIFAVRPATPKMVLFHTARKREVDTSADAKAQLERIRRRPGNENISVVYRDVFTAEPMSDAELATTNPIPVNVAADIPVRVVDRSRARHSGSHVRIEAVAHSELARAAEEGRDPDRVSVQLDLDASINLRPFRLLRGGVGRREAEKDGVFQGVIRLSLGPIDPNIEVAANAPQPLCVTGSDKVDVTVFGDDDKPVLTKTLQLVSDAEISLTDSTFSAERTSAHIGEAFFVAVNDADRDATDEPDRIEAEAMSLKTGVKRPMTLTETMPHSGVFTGRLRPMMFAPGETIPSVATGGVASAHEVLTEDRFAVAYGDGVVFRYVDRRTLPGTPSPRSLSVTGTVFRGSNGDVRLFSKRFADRDAAVLVQFRLAECLFEQAKEHRRLKQPEKSAADIAEGRFILEEALKNYPDSSHVVQGEFLLANLYQELATEAKDAGDAEKAQRLYQDALSRFSQILGTWPEGEYAARSQYHKALCLEMLKDYDRAAEEYVKMTYLYPESDLVGDAAIRLATHYYTKEKRYDVAGHIYQNFQKRFPQHPKAARSLFMAGSCYIKQAETIMDEVEKLRAANKSLPKGYKVRVDNCYRDAADTFMALVDEYRDTAAAKLKAQALYWAGDVYARRKDFPNAYRCLKRCIFEYPETEWARRARGLLLQEERNFEGME